MQEIDEFVLLNLKEDEINQLFKGKSLGLKVKFQTRLKEYVERQKVKILQTGFKVIH